MQFAKNKYDIIREKDLWQAPTPEEQQILALRAEVNELKKGKLKPKSQHNRNKSGNRNQQRNNEKPQWMFEEPDKKLLYKYKWWNNKKWWWCGDVTRGKCNQYRQHKGKDCHGGKPKDDEKKQPNSSKRPSYGPTKPKPILKIKHESNSDTTANKKIKLTKALAKQANVVDDDEDNISISSR